MTRIELIALVVVFSLLCLVPRKMPKNGLTVTYGCPGNWQQCQTTNQFYLTFRASNGPTADVIYGIYSVPLYPLTVICQTNSLL